MKKLILYPLLALMIVSCGNNSSSKSKLKQAKLDSIQQVRNDSIAVVQDSIKQIRKDSLAEVNRIQDSIFIAEVLESAKTDYHRTISLRKKYIGMKYEHPHSTNFIGKYGSPTTLEGTDNDWWIVYFPKGNLTVVLNKNTYKFVNIHTGKYPGLKYDVTAELSKLIGKRMKFYDYVEKVSSVKYGTVERLGDKICYNKDCLEYYPKGNFTTLAYWEFNDKGDFITLKKIIIGKSTRLKDY